MARDALTGAAFVSTRSISPFWFAVALATLVGAALRVTALDGQSLWYDEVYSVEMLEWPLSVILTVRDGHPPLFHVILLGLKPLFGEYSGRVFSAFVGTATIPLLALLGKRMFDRPTGALSAWLLAISPLHVWHSREGRMYALYMFFAVVSSLALERIVHNRNVRAYAAWTAAVLGGLLTHYGFVAMLAAQMIFVAMSVAHGARRRRELLPLAVIAACGVVALLPLMRELASGPIGNERGFNPLGLPYTAFTFLVGFGIGPTITDLHWQPQLSVMRGHWLEIAVTAMALIALGVIVLRGLQDWRRWNVYVLIWLCVPPLLLATRSGVSGTSQNVRYVICSLPAFSLLVAYGLRHQGRAVVGLMCATIFTLSAISVGRQFFDPRYQREDVRSAATYLAQNARPDDRIVISAAEQKLTLAHYLGPAREIEKLPVRIVRSQNEVNASLAQWSGRPTWLVLTREWGEDPHHYLRDRVSERRPGALATSFAGVSVFRLDP